MELKRPTTFEEQIKLLEQKDIKIANKESCKDVLSGINYYRLSGYYLPFIKKDEEKCFITINFERIQNIYSFDAELRNLISFAIENYGVNYQALESWLRCITDLRNRCAHYSRIYYWIFPAIPKMPNGEKYVPTRRLFAQLFMLKLMYPEKDKWNDEFLKPLIKLVNKYKKDISLKHLDFPYRWKTMLKHK